MSGANDSYDPKRVAALDEQNLQSALSEAESAIAAAIVAPSDSANRRFLQQRHRCRQNLAIAAHKEFEV